MAAAQLPASRLGDPGKWSVPTRSGLLRMEGGNVHARWKDSPISHCPNCQSLIFLTQSLVLCLFGAAETKGELETDRRAVTN